MGIIRSKKIRNLGFIIGLFLLLSLISAPAHAKTYTDEYLLDTGVKAYERDDLVTAVMYLFAYKERNPDLLQKNPKFRKELIDALDYCIKELKKSEVALGKIRKNNTPVGFSVAKITKPPSITIPSDTPRQVSPAIVHRPIAPTNAPRQVSPKPNAVFDHYPRTTTLKWRPVKGAVSYAVEIDCFHCCESGKWCSEVNGNTTIVSNLQETQHVFDFVGAQPGRWRVWAIFKNGKTGVKSSWREFRYTK